MVKDLRLPTQKKTQFACIAEFDETLSTTVFEGATNKSNKQNNLTHGFIVSLLLLFVSNKFNLFVSYIYIKIAVGNNY